MSHHHDNCARCSNARVIDGGWACPACREERAIEQFGRFVLLEIEERGPWAQSDGPELVRIFTESAVERGLARIRHPLGEMVL